MCSSDDEHELMEIEMTKTKASPEVLTEEALNDLAGGPVFVKIPGLPGDVRATSFELTTTNRLEHHGGTIETLSPGG